MQSAIANKILTLFLNDFCQIVVIFYKEYNRGGATLKDEYGYFFHLRCCYSKCYAKPRSPEYVFHCKYYRSDNHSIFTKMLKMMSHFIKNIIAENSRKQSQRFMVYILFIQNKNSYVTKAYFI